MPTGGGSSSGLISYNGDAAISSVAGSALNTDIITGDFSAYQSIKVNLAGTFVATWTVQVCNEPTFTTGVTTATIWNNATAGWISGTGTAGSSFSIPTNQGRYIRIRVTSFTSGSITSVVSGSQSDIGSSIQLLNGQVTKTNRSGFITTANTAQTLMTANLNRTGWMISNKSTAIIFINELVAATGNTSDYPLQPGESKYYGAGALEPTTSTSISIISSLVGAEYQSAEWNQSSVGNSTLFVQGATPAGKQLESASYPIVEATYFTANTLTSGTITTGNTSQTLLASNLTRQGFEVFNSSNNDLFLGIGSTPNATTFTGIRIPSMGGYSTIKGVSYTAQINIIGSTTGQQFSVIQF